MLTDAEFYKLADYYYEEQVHAKLTAAENLRQVTDLGGYIAGTDAEYAGWYTGIKPVGGRSELTAELVAALKDNGIEIVKISKGEGNE